MTAALFALKRAQGVHRPALAVQIPVPGTDGPPLVFLDCGANTDVRPQHLIQFAFLGSAFCAAVLGADSPRVALLSVGEEQKKGRPDVVEAHEALTDAEGIRFIGNVEGRDLLSGEADVVVTDGFTGNVTLKTLEGTAKAVGGCGPRRRAVGSAGRRRRSAAAAGPGRAARRHGSERGRRGDPARPAGRRGRGPRKLHPRGDRERGPAGRPRRPRACRRADGRAARGLGRHAGRPPRGALGDAG